jgi:hypothetical protein
MVCAGTTDGLFICETDGRRRRWRRRGPSLRHHSVNHVRWNGRTRTLYAATLDEGIFSSRTFGRTWAPVDGGLPIRRVWGRLAAGLPRIQRVVAVVA